MRLKPAPYVAVGVWVLLVDVGVWLGEALYERGHSIVLHAPPILAEPTPIPGLNLALPIVAALGLIAVLPSLVERVRWTVMIAVVGLASAVWTVALAMAEGRGGLTRGITDRTDYLVDLPAVRADASGFLRGFTRHIGRFEIQTRGHPPGMLLILDLLDRVGLRGPGWAATLIIGVAATAPIAVLLTVREVAGERAARRCAPWLALTPAAIWIATSADALYMGVGAWAIALVVLASGRHGYRSAALAVGGGLLGGLALMGSYGIILLATIPAAVLVSRRADQRNVIRIVGASIAGVTAILAVFAVLGFWWIDGLRATIHQYAILDLDRPYAGFLVINVAAWALALGPATFVGLALLHDRRVWTIVGASLAAVALAELSGLSAGEVERIWLPFTLWVLPAAAAINTTRLRTRVGLALQAASAMWLISTVTTQW